MGSEPLAAVTFDFWETLVQDTPENLGHATERRIVALGAVLTRAGCGRPRAHVEAAHERCWTLMTERFWTEDRDPSIRDQVRLFFDCLESGLGERLDERRVAEAVEAYGEAALAAPPTPMPGAVDTLRTLAGRGLKLGIVSNTGRTPGAVLRRILERHDMLRYFDAVGIAYSDEVGYRKPDARIFTRSLRALGSGRSASSPPARCTSATTPRPTSGAPRPWACAPCTMRWPAPRRRRSRTSSSPTSPGCRSACRSARVGPAARSHARAIFSPWTPWSSDWQARSRS
jgi:putative hydrolase of the HAD superfamily